MSGLKLFSNVSITHRVSVEQNTVFKIFKNVFKVIMISVTTGVAIMGILATYLSRRKTVRPQRHPRTRTGGGRRTRNSMRSPNGL